jgi:ribosomal protein S18 acetylase RimI-like enzyme
MTSQPAWSITESPSAEELSVLSDGIVSFGRALAIGGNPLPIACFVRDNGAIIAGGSGRTEFDRLFIHYLWVAEHCRERGLGSAVLTRLEAAARERGAIDAVIETMNDRTAALYRRLGYEPVAVIPRWVGSFTRHILIKRLT